MSVATVRLIHSRSEKAEAGARVLERSGHTVDSTPVDPSSLRALRAHPPDVIVIDLARAPSRGRDLGLLLRKTAGTRDVPLVFAGGEADRVAHVESLLPDAVFTGWRSIRGAVVRAMSRRPSAPVVPESTFAAYAGTPLAKKLGIRPGSVVALVGAPSGFERRIDGLPEGAVVKRGARGRCDIIIWFARSRGEVGRRVGTLGGLAGVGGLWIAWPKRASGLDTDLTQVVVRRMGLAAGLVDYKVCSIDETWSGLRFTRRERRKRR
jgi:CheY-like chemotaxis protein